MSSKISTIFLAGILLFASAGFAVGQESALTSDRHIKAKVNDLGPGAKVTVLMKDGTKVHGSISQILDDSFDVTVKKETQSSIISYRDVAKVKKRGWPTSLKVGAGVAIGAVALVLILHLTLSADDLLQLGR